MGTSAFSVPTSVLDAGPRSGQRLSASHLTLPYLTLPYLTLPSEGADLAAIWCRLCVHDM